jgi:hypothetical protein
MRMPAGFPAEYRFSAVDAPAGTATADDMPATIVGESLTDDPRAANCGAFAIRLKPGTFAAQAHPTKLT